VRGPGGAGGGARGAGGLRERWRERERDGEREREIGERQVAVRVAREGSLLVLPPECLDEVLGPLARVCLSFQVWSRYGLVP
jgi:hypothetical protein